ncbi:MAG: TIM barrel protein [Lachnospiraceae bacterium]|nr:TIM barrel protein [Lachnospiraceae bacterium]
MSLRIGVQSKNVVFDDDPAAGFLTLKQSGFDCCDFSLNNYLKNTDLYQENINRFFDRSVTELEDYFAPHKAGAAEAGIKINQMHMPYPTFVPGAKKETNDYLWNEVGPKSMEICRFLECPHIVVHGFKLERYYGSEEAEWEKTAEFIEFLAPMAREYGITICMENLYNGLGGHMVEGPGCNAYKAVQRIDSMNEKYGAEVLGFCYDTGHGNLVGLDPYKFITALGSRLKVLHMHENDGIADLHQLPFTFTRTRENASVLDWDGMLNGLKEIRFDGVLSFETAPVLDCFPGELKEDALQMISKIGRYFAGRIS